MCHRRSEPLEQRVLFVAGDLDLGFGTNGIARADFGTRDVQGIDVATFGNRIYAAGIVTAEFDQPGWIALAAFDSSGRPDPTFGGDGTVLTSVSAYESFGGNGEMLVQPDGKIVVLSGHNLSGGGGFSAARFNPDGSADTSFGGGDGKVELAFGQALAMAPGGKLVISGGPRFRVARLNPDGSFDPTFGGTGRIDLDFGGSNDSGQTGAVDVAVTDDGRMLLVGAQKDDTPDDNFYGWYAAAARLNPDGSYDTTFGENGRDLSHFGSIDNGYSAAATGPHGEVLIASMEGEVKARPWVVTGSATIPAGTFFSRLGYSLPTITRMHIQPDGKVVVSGTVGESFYDDGSPATLLARYNPDGSFDPTFAQGRVARPTSARTALTPGGDIVALAGSGPQVPLGGITGLAVARYRGHDADNRSTVIPAESAEWLNGANIERANAGYAGSGYVDFVRDTGATAAYELYAYQSGTYELRIRYANGSRRARVLNIDGKKVAFLPTGSWTRWREARVSIPISVHGPQFAERRVIELTTTGRNGPNIDTITVVRPDLPVTLQAEDATLVGASALSQNPGYDGRGYADFIDPDGSVEFEFNSPARQALALTIRYANGAATARPLTPILNGTAAGYFVFRPTGSWTTWRTETISVEVEAGINRLRLAAGADGVGPNLDWLRVG